MSGLRRGLALPRQRGLFDLQGGAAHQPSIGRDQVPGLQLDDVPHHQVACVDLCELTVSDHLGRDVHHVGQRGDSGFGLGFLAVAHEGVEHREPEQQHPCGVLPDGAADDAGSEQQELHEVPVLVGEDLPHRACCLCGQLVRPVPAQPSSGLIRAQASVHVGRQGHRDLLDGQGVPGGKPPVGTNPTRCCATRCGRARTRRRVRHVKVPHSGVRSTQRGDRTRGHLRIPQDRSSLPATEVLLGRPAPNGPVLIRRAGSGWSVECRPVRLSACPPVLLSSCPPVLLSPVLLSPVRLSACSTPTDSVQAVSASSGGGPRLGDHGEGRRVEETTEHRGLPAVRE